MKILIADDSKEKTEELENFFAKSNKKTNIFKCESFKDTISLIMKEDFDLVMLDMTMPSKGRSSRGSNNKKRSLAGKDVLSTVSYNGIDRTKFIIFSQFSELGRMDEVISLSEIYEDLSTLYPRLLIGCVTYDSSTDMWLKKLENLLKESGLYD